jgi:hypothetical protein
VGAVRLVRIFPLMRRIAEPDIHIEARVVGGVADRGTIELSLGVVHAWDTGRETHEARGLAGPE